MNKTLKTLIYGIYGIGFAGTLFLMLGVQRIWNVYTSKSFKFENAGYLLIGFVVIFVLLLLNRKFGRQIETFLEKRSKLLLAASLAFLLIWQLYTCYGGYFVSGWDAGAVLANVQVEYLHDYAQLNSAYFSQYPNNLFLVWLFTQVAVVADFFGLHNIDYELVSFQCVLDVMTMYLVYVIARDFTHSTKTTWLAYAIAYLFVGISPWFIVAYSDATGVIFPVLSIRLYQLALQAKRGRSKLGLSALLGLWAALGYFIKPQTVIVVIALVLVEALRIIGPDFKKRAAAFISKLAFCCLGIMISAAVVTGLAIPSLHFQTNSELAVGWQHFLMMGLNDSTDGVFSADDVGYTMSFATAEERNAGNLAEAQQRIKDFGPKGMLRHLCRKQLVNYGDGTFAWAVEGGSFMGNPEWAQNLSSDFIRSFILPGGANYDTFLSMKQLMWVLIVFFQLFVIFYKRKDLLENGESTLLVMMVAIIGLTLFELMFEARARYLFCYAPIYALLAAWGMRNLKEIIRRHWC